MDDLQNMLAKFRARIGAVQPEELPDGVTGCSECGGVGWAPQDDGRYRRCACVLGSMEVYADGVPYEFHEAAFHNYREEDGSRAALEKARQFLGGTRDLYLVGGVGAGKTRLACSVLNEHVRQRRTGFFARVPMVLHQLQPGHEAGDLEARLFTTSLLVLDDLGAERDQATDYTRRTLLMIYEARGDRGVRTIFTSNKSLTEIGKMQDDDRLASRIAGRADVIKITAVDQRMRRWK
jgi:DNA replication protein DnaC